MDNKKEVVIITRTKRKNEASKQFYLRVAKQMGWVDNEGGRDEI
jgi:hypothetical protein